MILKNGIIIHNTLIAIILVLSISTYFHSQSIVQSAYALYTYHGPKHSQDNCSLPCNYIVTVNNYNFTIRYTITAGGTDLPSGVYIMNLTSITVDTIHKTLIINTSSDMKDYNYWADLALAIPRDLLSAPLNSDDIHVDFSSYADGMLVTNEGCDTGYEKPLACVYASRPKDGFLELENVTLVDITMNHPGIHSVSIVGTQVAPELSGLILIPIVSALLGVIVVLTRVRPRDVKRPYAMQ